MSSQAQEILESLPGSFLPAKAANVKALIQFNLSGEGGGEWTMEVAGGQCQVKQGTATQPDVTLSMTADDFAALYQNKLNPIQAFMGGKIKVTGNVGLVMQLLNWFDR